MSQSPQEAFHRGVIQDGAVVFDRDPGLPDGTPVEITVRPRPTGAPAGVLAAMSQPPRLVDADVGELLDQIDQGKRPVRFESPATLVTSDGDSSRLPGLTPPEDSTQ